MALSSSHVSGRFAKFDNALEMGSIRPNSYLSMTFYNYSCPKRLNRIAKYLSLGLDS